MKRKINLLLLIASILFSFNSKATVMYVDSAHVGGLQNGTSWASAFSNLQSGIDAANAGDSVWVAKGTYIPAFNTSFSMKEGVKIFGGFTNTDILFADRDWQNDSTILKGNGSRVITNSNNNLTNTSRIDGFTVTNGNATMGAGILNLYSSPIITNCFFSNNMGDNGGAIEFFGARTETSIINCIFSNNITDIGGGGAGMAIIETNTKIKIIDCTFLNNSSPSGVGGGLMLGGATVGDTISSFQVTNCSFINNTAGNAGAINITSYSTSSINDCTFSNNTSSTNAGAIRASNTVISNCNFNNNVSDWGGAISGGAYGRITKCNFTNNSATYGGAISTTSTTIDNCKFTGNVATVTGAAIYGNGNQIIIYNDLFSHNITNYNGGIITNVENSKIINCSFINNASSDTTQARVLKSNGSPKISNCIIWGNSIGAFGSPYYPIIRNSLIQGVSANIWYGIINGTTNPQFIDTSISNYQLQATSPCINGGINDSIPTGFNTDLLGNARIYNNIVDMGVYEFGSAPLALNLISFTGKKQYEQNVLLQWQLIQDVATDFELERSVDGQIFLPVYHGNSKETEADKFHYLDQETQSNNFYRLKLQKSDGSVDYSNVLYFNFNLKNESIKVYPNPAKETIRISFTDEKLLRTKAMLMDIYGRTVREVELNIKSQQLSMAGLSSGVYILKTITGNSVKIIKE